RIDVACHAGGAADEEMRAVVEPRPERRGVLAHAMLDIDALRLVARESGVEPRQEPVARVIAQLRLVEKIGVAALIAKKEPVASAGVQRAPLLQERAERCDAGA